MRMGVLDWYHFWITTQIDAAAEVVEYGAHNIENGFDS